jgi:predicted nucleic acid-binding protein
MTGLDCNILVQLALAEHPANIATVHAVQTEAQHGEQLVFPTLVITEFLHVVTDERRFSPPLTMVEALDWIQDFLANPMINLIEPTKESLHQTLRWMRQFNLGRKRILDTNLAAILHTAGVRRLLTSNPGDFSVYGVLEILTP